MSLEEERKSSYSVEIKKKTEQRGPAYISKTKKKQGAKVVKTHPMHR